MWSAVVCRLRAPAISYTWMAMLLVHLISLKIICSTFNSFVPCLLKSLIPLGPTWPQKSKQHNLGYVIEIQCATVYIQVTWFSAHIISIGTRQMAFVCSQSVLRVFFHSCASSIFWKYDNFIFVKFSC